MKPAVRQPRPPTAAPKLPHVAWWMPLAIVVAGTWALWPALGGEFVYDDRLMVERNPLLGSLASLPRIFTSAYWDFLHDPDVVVRNGYWRPLSATTLLVTRLVGGLRPLPFHLVCLAWHLVASLAALALARRLARSSAVGFLTGLLFAVHPLHVESTAWITSLSDPIFGALVLLSLAAFARWRDRGSRGVPVAPAAFLAMALLAKEHAVATLPLALAVDLARAGSDPPRPRGARAWGRAYAPFAAVLVLYWAARAYVFGSPIAGLERSAGEWQLGLARIQWMRVELLGGGIGLSALPLEPELFRTIRPDLSLASPALWGHLGWIAGLAAAAWLAYARRAWVVLGALAFVPIAISPLLLRVDSLGQFVVSDRFYYLAVFGTVLAAVAAAFRFLPRAALWPAFLAVALAFGWKSHERSRVWRDEETLFRASVEESPRSAYGRWGLGRVLLERFQREGDPEDLRAALEQFERAQDLVEAAQEGDESIWVSTDDALQANLGVAWSYLFEATIDRYGDFETPRRVFEAILETWPENARARIGIAVAMRYSGRLEEAKDVLHDVLRDHPRTPEAHYNLGIVHFELGEWRAAVRAFESSLELRPGRLDDRLWLARALIEAGWTDRARAIAEEAHREHPEEPEPYFQLGTIAAIEKDRTQALAWLDRLLEAHPDHGAGRYQRALVLLEMGERDEALFELRRACDLVTEHFGAHYNLGALLAEGGQVAEALPYLERAYAIGGEERLLPALRGTLLERLDDPGRLRELARVDARRGDLASALRFAERSRELAPDAPATLLLLGELLRDGGRPTAAAEALRRLVEVAPRHFQAHADLGLLLADIGDLANAERHLETALSIGPPAGVDPELAELYSERLRKRLSEIRGG